MFFNIFDPSVFDNVVHDVISFIKVTVSSDKNFNGGTIDIMTVVGKSFFSKSRWNRRYACAKI